MKYCEHIAHTLSFDINNIMPCCTGNNNFAPRHFSIFDNDKEYLETLNLDNSQKTMFEELNSSNLEKYSCSNCIFLKDVDEYSDDNKINSIYLRFWTLCNCSCVYCDNKRGDEKRHSFGFPAQYSPFNFIKKVYEENKIDTNNLIVRVQGGDLAVLPEFEDYVSLFEKYGYKEMHFSTSNIVYQPKIEQVLKRNKGSLNVSIDCGSKETYLTIKQVDCFDKVVENLRKYLENTKEKNNISVHYIIVKNYNDNKKEISKFINLMKDIGIQVVGIRIDHKDLNNFLSDKKTDTNLQHYRNLISHFYKEAQKSDFSIDGDNYIEQNFVLNKQNSNISSKLSHFMLKLFNKS